MGKSGNGRRELTKRFRTKEEQGFRMLFIPKVRVLVGEFGKDGIGTPYCSILNEIQRDLAAPGKQQVNVPFPGDVSATVYEFEQ